MPMTPLTAHRVFFAFLLCFGSMPLIAPSSLFAQVADADCFSGACNGAPGFPECPDHFAEVGFVAYANNRADFEEKCVTVVSCTNFSAAPTRLDCRFYHGFNSIPEGGDPQDAYCHALGTKDLFPGDTSECATTADSSFRAGGILGAAEGDCDEQPPFEGKGLVCAKGGDADRILCHAYLSCGDGSTLEPIPFFSHEALRHIREDSSPGKRGSGKHRKQD